MTTPRIDSGKLGELADTTPDGRGAETVFAVDDLSVTYSGNVALKGVTLNIQKNFVTALSQAGFFVRTIAVPGAGHYWMSDPLEEAGSLTGAMAPKLVRFLREKL